MLSPLVGLLRNKWNGMTGHFRSNVWDPVLILSQIICMQCLFYVFIGFWVFLLDWIVVVDVATDQLFTMTDIGLYEVSGKNNLIAYALTSFTCAVGLLFVVGRTKQCLDFSATVILIHFFLCWIYNGRVPQTFWWWIANIVTLIFMTVSGEFLCMRRELKAIPVMGTKVDL